MRIRPTFMLVAVLAVGCSPGYAPSGTDGEDAALVNDGGADAGPDGSAGADADGGGQSDGGGDGDAEAGQDADSGGEPDGGEGDAGPGSCVPNHDGVIERDEVTMRAGLHATFKVAEDVAVDTHGTEQGDGSRVWDLSGDLPGDRRVLVELRSPDGTWFKPEYPDAEYVAELNSSGDKLGVFGVDDQGLYLQGVVSPDDGWDRTELDYEPPAQILKFPMEQGTSWQTEAAVSGRYEGAAVTGDETYSSQVDAHGTLKTPFGDFEVLRVRTDLERDSIWTWTTTTQTTYTFVAECFGTVATIRSQENEDEAEFSEAAEVRRLTQ